MPLRSVVYLDDIAYLVFGKSVYVRSLCKHDYVVSVALGDFDVGEISRGAWQTN